MKCIDMVGTRSGRLLVIKKQGVDNRGEAMWQCQCDCGNTSLVRGYELRKQRILSCGCYDVEALVKRSTIHGHSRRKNHSATYISWSNMKTRCINSNASQYSYYGGRGITICERWLNSFEAFLEDMGERPVGKTLDRINPNGNYEPSNCRWATSKEQARNKR